MLLMAVIMGIFINNISQCFIVCFVKETLQVAGSEGWIELCFMLQIWAKTDLSIKVNKGESGCDVGG